MLPTLRLRVPLPSQRARRTSSQKMVVRGKDLVKTRRSFRSSSMSDEDELVQ